jgi:hypothetical protein
MLCGYGRAPGWSAKHDDSRGYGNEETRSAWAAKVKAEIELECHENYADCSADSGREEQAGKIGGCDKRKVGDKQWKKCS